MFKEDVILLVKRTPDGSDNGGNPLWKESCREVFAVIKGVKRSEYYSALSAGLRPEVTIEIFEAEYNGEKIIEINTSCGEKRRMNVIRTYPVGGEKLEITCNDISESG